jgi:cyclopropane-fatty-acyl-phospholipid synthase
LIPYSGWDILPDFVIRKGIRKLLRQRLKDERADTPEKRLIQVSQFAEDLKKYPVAIETRAANEQHYEVPAAFYQLCLGPRLKYSSCFYQKGNESIKEAEETMLALTCQRAELKDGQKILELGCGWGSLTLWMAEKYPLAQITSVSNSSSQREYILDQCKKRGLNNVTVITCDMNQFSISPETFDRVVSVEMFEHMKNWQELLRRISTWLKFDGKLFFHIFTHRDCAYHFESRDGTDWMSRHFLPAALCLRII